MNWRAYYVFWYVNTSTGVDSYGPPLLWFYVPISQANQVDKLVENIVFDPLNPYRDHGIGSLFYEVKTIAIGTLPPPPSPDPDDPTLESIP